MVPCEGEAHAAAPIKIACVGDSLTDGSKSSGGKKGDTAYPAWLGRILGSSYDVRNFGAAGDTLLRGHGAGHIWRYCRIRIPAETKEFAPRYRHHHARHQRFQGRLLERDTVQDRGEGAGEGVPGSRQPTGRVFRESPHSYRIAPGTKYVSVNSVNRLHPVQESLIRDERWNTIDLYARPRTGGSCMTRRRSLQRRRVPVPRRADRRRHAPVGADHRLHRKGAGHRKRDGERRHEKEPAWNSALPRQGTAAGNAGDSSDGNGKRDALRGSDASWPS